jgi:hypothetical protein
LDGRRSSKLRCQLVAWERKGKPHLLKETVPFWLIAAATATVLTLTTKAANQYAISAGLSHVQQVVFVDGCFFLANTVTFLTHFIIFYHALFSERSSELRSLTVQEARQHRLEGTSISVDGISPAIGAVKNS